MNRWIAVLAALVLAGAGVVKGTWAVGGSDSSCYALMAEAFAGGAWQPSTALAIDAPWPDASRTFAPGGFVPSPVRADAASPVCAPGVSVLMAPLVAMAGRDALFVLSPIAGAVLVWCAFVLGRRLAGDAAGAVAAVLVASSPIVLYQTVQPMNDVVGAALWMASLTAIVAGDAGSRRSAAVAGACAGLAILVRPNLAPLAGVVLAAAVAGRPGPAARIGVVFALAAAPGIAAVLLLNQVLYGQPFASGYGSASALFSVEFVGANAAALARRLWETQWAVPLLALAAPWVLGVQARRAAWALLAASAVVVGFYLFYTPYPEWWYLRFQLLAVALLLTLAGAVAVALARRARVGGVVPILVVVLALQGVRTARDRQAFDLQALEGRYRDTAAFVRDRLPEHAVLITVWQSGGMRFHAGRDALLWDSLDPAWLDRAVAWLAGQGRVPYFLFERREEAEFRNRFGGDSALGGLDWPPRFDLGRQARIYDPADRERYRAGETYATEQVRPPRR